MSSLSIINVDNEGNALNSTDLSTRGLLQNFGIGYYHSPFSYFPPEVARDIWDIVHAKYNMSDHDITPIVPCSYLQNSSTLDFTFASFYQSNLTVHVPLSDITWHTGTGPNLDNGPNQDCQLAIKSTPPGLPNYLSWRMVKSLYLLFDLENQVIWVARTNFNATTDNVIALSKGGVYALPRASYGSDPNQPASTADANSQPVADKKALALHVSLAVVIPIFVIALILTIYFVDKRRKKRWVREAREKEERQRAEEIDKEIPLHQIDSEPEPEPDRTTHELDPETSQHMLSELPGDSDHGVNLGMGERGDSQARIDAGEVHELG
jgi:hypothetical protein